MSVIAIIIIFWLLFVTEKKTRAIGGAEYRFYIKTSSLRSRQPAIINHFLFEFHESSKNEWKSKSETKNIVWKNVECWNLRLPFVDHQQQIELLRVHQDANVLEIGRAEFLTLATLKRTTKRNLMKRSFDFKIIIFDNDSKKIRLRAHWLSGCDAETKWRWWWWRRQCSRTRSCIEQNKTEKNIVVELSTSRLHVVRLSFPHCVPSQSHSAQIGTH